MDPTENNNRRWLKILIIVAGTVLVLFAGYQIYLALHFRLTSTSPKTNNVASVSPYLKVNFNRKLSGDKLSLSSANSIIKSYRLDGKTLIIDLKTPLTAGYEYSIKIKSITDTNGDKITNKTLSFTPKDTPWQKLPKDQQTAILEAQQAQAAKTPSLKNIDFKGFQRLVSYGVTNSQIASLQQAFFVFAPKTTSVTVSNAAAVPHNSASSSTLDTINFTAKVGSNTYNARFDYSLLTDSMRLYLYDANGAQVYDSGAPAAEGH